MSSHRFFAHSMLCASLIFTSLAPADTADTAVQLDGTTFHKPSVQTAHTPKLAKACYGVAAVMAVAGGIGFGVTQWKEDKAANRYSDVLDEIDSKPVGTLTEADFAKLSKAAEAYKSAKMWKKISLGVLGGAAIPAAIGVGSQLYNSHKVTKKYKQQYRAWDAACKKRNARELLRKTREKQYVLAQAINHPMARRLRGKEFTLLDKAMESEDIDARQKAALCRQTAALYEVGSVAWAEALAGGASITATDFEQRVAAVAAARPADKAHLQVCRQAALAEVQPVGDDFDQFRERDRQLARVYQQKIDEYGKGVNELQKDYNALPAGEDQRRAEIQEQITMVRRAAEPLLTHRITFAKALQEQGREESVTAVLIGGGPFKTNAETVWQSLVSDAPGPMRQWAMEHVCKEMANAVGLDGLQVMEQVAREQELSLALDDVVANGNNARTEHRNLVGDAVKKDGSAALNRENYLDKWFSPAGEQEQSPQYRLVRLKNKAEAAFAQASDALERCEAKLAADLDMIEGLGAAEKSAAKVDRNISGQEKEVTRLRKEVRTQELWGKFFSAEERCATELPAQTVARRVRYARALCDKQDSRQVGILVGGLLDRDSVEKGAQLLHMHHDTAVQQLVLLVSDTSKKDSVGYQQLTKETDVNIKDKEKGAGWARETRGWVVKACKECFDDQTKKWDSVVLLAERGAGVTQEALETAKKTDFNQALEQTCPAYYAAEQALLAADQAPPPKDYRHVVNLEFYKDRADDLVRFVSGRTNSASVPLYMLKRNASGQVVDEDGNIVSLTTGQYIEGDKVKQKEISGLPFNKRETTKVIRTFKPVWVINQAVTAQDSVPVAVTVKMEIDYQQHKRLDRDGYLRSAQLNYGRHARRAFDLLEQWAKDGQPITKEMRAELTKELCGMQHPHKVLLAADKDRHLDISVEPTQTDHFVAGFAGQADPVERARELSTEIGSEPEFSPTLDECGQLRSEVAEQAAKLEGLVSVEKWGVEVRPDQVPNFTEQLNEHIAAFRQAKSKEIADHNEAVHQLSSNDLVDEQATAERQGMAEEDREKHRPVEGAIIDKGMAREGCAMAEEDKLRHRPRLRGGMLVDKEVPAEIERTKNRLCNEYFLQQCSKYRRAVAEYKGAWGADDDHRLSPAAKASLRTKINTPLPAFNVITADKKERQKYFNAVYRYCSDILSPREQGVVRGYLCKQRATAQEANYADRQALKTQHVKASSYMGQLFKRMYRDVEKRCNGTPATKIQAFFRGYRVRHPQPAADALAGDA